MGRPLLALLLAAAARAEWGKDTEPAAAAQQIRLVAEDLAPLLKGGGDVAHVLERHGNRVEALKRFRNPELLPLFEAMLAEDDWRAKHRALFCLERMGDPSAFPQAAALLRHPHRRVREKAAIACIRLWRPGMERPAVDVDAERDFHVRRCLEALERRMAGWLPFSAAEEEVETLPQGLRIVPYRNPVIVLGGSFAGKVGAAGLPVADRWTAPILGYGEEEVAEAPLEPFGRAAHGHVHLGQDMGACLDGAGVYAPAAGVVRLVDRDFVVLEHHLRRGEIVCSYLFHVGDRFVATGDTVECGQIVGTIGMGFSTENGGCLAHLHLGLRAGAFETGGREIRKEGEPIGDWYDPAEALPRWIAWTRPLVADLRPVVPPLRSIRADALRGSLARAHAAAVRARDRAEPGSDEHVDATYLAGEVARAPANALARAAALREGGYPGDALDELKRWARELRSLPGADALGATVDEWQADPLLKKALEGEPRVRRTAVDDRAQWRKLLGEYGDTCLEGRIRQRLR